MLLAAKPKAFVVDRGEQATLVARVSSLRAPLVVECIREVANGDSTAFADVVAELRGKQKSGFSRALCGINPTSRVLRRSTLDLKRAKDPEYLNEFVASQFRVDAEQYLLAVLDAADGSIFDPANPGVGKEVVFAGLANKDIAGAQEELVKVRLYPDRLEISSLAAVGAIIDCLRFAESAKSTLVLEVGAETTQSFILSSRGFGAARPISVGYESMIPIVQKELGLRDEESARKLLLSNTFDFTGMGAILCKRLLKELQSSMGFYEVQTGQSITQMVCPVLPSRLGWLESVIASQLGLTLMPISFAAWLKARHVTLSAEVPEESLNARFLGLLGLILPLTPT